jgi:hypothetical protein
MVTGRDGDVDELVVQRFRDQSREIGEKKGGALEDSDQYEFLALVIHRDLRSDLTESLLNLFG